jgi:hypothetical protein
MLPASKDEGTDKTSEDAASVDHAHREGKAVIELPVDDRRQLVENHPASANRDRGQHHQEHQCPVTEHVAAAGNCER